MKPMPLTQTEAEVLRAYSQGLSTQEIADLRFISFKTVEFHRRKILLKMGAANLVDAVVTAIRHGIVIL